MQSPPFPRYLVPPRSKYSPQHHVLKHPQPPFLPQYITCIIINTLLHVCGPGSSVGIVTHYGLEVPGIESQWGWHFPPPSKPVLWPTQPSIQWVPGLSFPPSIHYYQPNPVHIPTSWRSILILSTHLRLGLPLLMLYNIMKAITYVGDLIFVSFRLVFGCFWIVSSWPSNVFRYWICCGDGTGIKFGSLFAWFGCCCCFCCAIDCSVRQYMPSTENSTILYFNRTCTCAEGHIQSCIAWRRGYVLRNESLGDFVAVS